MSSFQKTRIISNTIIQIISKIGTVLLGLFTLGLITRYLGQEKFGYYTTILAFLQLFSVIADWGLYIITLNEISTPKIDEKRIFSNLFTLRIITGLIFIFSVNSLIWLFPYPYLIKIGVVITSFSLFFNLLIQNLTSLFQKRIKMLGVALADLLAKTFLLLFVFLTVFYNLGFRTILFSLVLAALLNFFILFFLAQKKLPFSFAFDFAYWKKILKEGWPIALSSIFMLIYFKTDTLILSLFRSQKEVGLYGAPYKILEVLIAFPAIFVGLVLPFLREAYKARDFESFGKIFQEAFNFLSIFTWPLVLGGFVLATPLMLFIAGKEFLISGTIFKILIWATGIIYFAHLPGFTIVALEKQREMLKYYLSAALFSLILYLIFIPLYGYWAAALITVGIEFFILLSASLMVLKTVQIKLSFKIFKKAFLASFLMSLFLIFLMKSYSLPWLILFGFFFYFTLLYLLGGLSKNLIKDFFRFKSFL